MAVFGNSVRRYMEYEKVTVRKLCYLPNVVLQDEIDWAYDVRVRSQKFRE